MFLTLAQVGGQGIIKGDKVVVSADKTNNLYKMEVADMRKTGSTGSTACVIFLEAV